MNHLRPGLSPCMLQQLYSSMNYTLLSRDWSALLQPVELCSTVCSLSVMNCDPASDWQPRNKIQLLREMIFVLPTPILYTQPMIELSLPSQDERQDERSKPKKCRIKLPNLAAPSTHTSITNLQAETTEETSSTFFLARSCKLVGRTLKCPGSLTIPRLSHSQHLCSNSLF